MMKQMITRCRFSTLALVLLLPVLSACGLQVAADAAGQDTHVKSYESALDATSRLALGTLQLEDTDMAVTEAQASALLPLWQGLASGKLQSEEIDAVLKQIEAAMTPDQLAAIAGLRRTEQDAQAWSETQAGIMPAGSMPAGGRPSETLTSAVLELLADRSGSAETEARMAEPANQTQVPASQDATAETDPSGPETASASAGEQEQAKQIEVVEPEASEAEVQPESTETDPTESVAQRSVSHIVRAGESLAGIAAAYGVTVASIVESNSIQDANLIEVGQELVIPDPSEIPDIIRTESEAPTASQATVAAPAPALEELEDTDPGPPLAIEVSANRATQDPLVEQSQHYLVTGIVRNDGRETYAVSAILATFFDAEGFRGTYDPKIREGEIVSAEWNWHGQTEAEFAALLLAPGEEWPFRVTITAQDMASFLLHPDAEPTERESLAVRLSGVQVTDLGTYLRISGTATNENAVAVKNVTVSGTRLDASGQIVSLGSTYVLEEEIAPGDSVSFALHVAKETYVRYDLYGQAERDW